MAELELTFRGITPTQIVGYLTELGAVQLGEELVGEEYRALVTVGQPHRIGSLTLPITHLRLTGAEGVLEELVLRLRRKTFRGGG